MTPERLKEIEDLTAMHHHNGDENDYESIRDLIAEVRRFHELHPVRVENLKIGQPGVTRGQSRVERLEAAISDALGILSLSADNRERVRRILSAALR